MTAWTSIPKGLGPQEAVCWWLRQQPDLQDQARKIVQAEAEGVVGDYMLKSVLASWLFTEEVDDHLVNELGMSPTLRNITRASMTRAQFDLIDWDKVREELVQEAGL